MPPGGAYAPPLTLAVAANEPFVTRYARVREQASAETSPSFPVTSTFELSQSGVWVVEAWGVDRVGNASSPVSAVYEIAEDLPRLISWQTAVGSTLTSRLPMMRAVFDRPMDTAQVQISGLVEFPDGPTAPYDGVAFWVDDRTVDMLPLARLPEGARAVFSPGPLSDATGRTVESNLTVEVVACRDCDGLPARLLRTSGPTEASAAATEWTVDLVFDRRLTPTDFNRLFVVSRDHSLSLPPCTSTCDGWRLVSSAAPSPSTTLTLTVDTDRLVPGDTALISLNHRDNRRPILATLHLPSGVTTAAAPQWTTVEVSPRGHVQAIDIVSDLPVRGSSLNAVLRVNGAPQAFRMERLGPSAGERLRLYPRTPWAAGDALALEVAAGALDAWGRALPSLNWSGTVPAAEAEWRLDWNVVDQAKLPFSAGALIAAATVEPPAARVEDLQVIDADSGARLDAFDTLALPIGGRKDDAGVSRIELRTAAWAPLIVHPRRLVVSGRLVAEGTQPTGSDTFVFEWRIGTPDRPYADPVSSSGLWSGMSGYPGAAGPGSLTWVVHGANAASADLSLTPVISGLEGWSFDAGTMEGDRRTFRAAATPFTLTTYSGPATAALRVGDLEIRRSAWILPISGAASVSAPTDGTTYTSPTTVDVAWYGGPATGATAWGVVLENLTSGTLRGFWRLPDEVRAFRIEPADLGAGAGTQQFRLSLVRLREPGDRPDRPDIPTEGLQGSSPITFAVEF